MIKGAATLHLRSQIWLWRFGTIWPLSLGLTALAAALYATELFYLAPQHRKAEDAAKALQLELARASKPVTTAEATDATQSKDAWSDLKGALAPETQVPMILRSMHASAKRHGIDVLSSDFQQQTLGKTGLVQQTVVMPFRASYAQAKLFLFDVLRTHPSVSLDQITIKREAVAQGHPETRVKFSIWVANESGGMKPASVPQVPK